MCNILVQILLRVLQRSGWRLKWAGWGWWIRVEVEMSWVEVGARFSNTHLKRIIKKLSEIIKQWISFDFAWNINSYDTTLLLLWPPRFRELIKVVYPSLSYYPFPIFKLFSKMCIPVITPTLQIVKGECVY